GCALTKGRALNLKHPTSVGSVSANPNEVRVQRLTGFGMCNANLNEVRVRPHKRSGVELGTHKRSCPDWKHEPAARMLSPGLSEARVQHPTSVGSVSANPNEVRVQHLTQSRMFNANLSGARASSQKIGRELEAFDRVRNVQRESERSEGSVFCFKNQMVQESPGFRLSRLCCKVTGFHISPLF